MLKVDYLIVGQGLAGTVLSHELIKRGLEVFVLDYPKENTATRLAAGVYNPVVYRRLNKGFMAEEFIPQVMKTYREIESVIAENILHPMIFRKLLTSIEELNNWQVNCGKTANKPFMSPQIFSENYHGSVHNPFGAGQILQAGVVNLSLMLDRWKGFLSDHNRFYSTKLNHGDFTITNDSVNVELGTNHIAAKHIVFCEGIGMAGNPWFNWLPMQQFKGEVLEIESQKLAIDTLLNRGVFVLPGKNKTFKVGATHNWRETDELPTEAGKRELLDKLDKIVAVPYRVTGHKAGLRPATRDRKPFLGTHPKHNNIHVFNGLGSKGVLMAPWMAAHLANYLCENDALLPIFDIKRYFKLFDS